MLDLSLLADRFVLGILSPADLRMSASDALVEGYDGFHLRILAGDSTGDPDELHERFDRVLDELGIPRPALLDAARRIVRVFAADALSGRITVREAAREISYLCDQLYDSRTVSYGGRELQVTELHFEYFLYDEPTEYRPTDAEIDARVRELLERVVDGEPA